MTIDSKTNTSGAYAAVTTLFFAWGLVTSLIDPLIASVKGIFSLSDFEAQLSASAFFIAYGLFSFPAAALLSAIKAVPTIILALGLMAVGCMLMLIAANVAVYALVLAGLFMLASGISVLQVAANPLAAGLGPPERSHFRLTLSQTFNSFGTFFGPYLGASLFLKGVEVKDGSVVTQEVRAAALTGIDRAFFWVAGLILLLSVFMWISRRRLTAALPATSCRERSNVFATIGEAFSSRWAIFGAGAMFVYVGAEVAIGTQLAFLLSSDAVLAISLESAGKLVSLYWGGAMIGRFVGAALLARFEASVLLRVNTAIACLLCMYVVFASGPSAGYAALSIGLVNSIMFPVIFTLTLDRSTASSEATSGLLCFAIVGGAVVPPIVGLVSQSTSYSLALIVPALCYALIHAFAVAAQRMPARRIDSPAPVIVH